MKLTNAFVEQLLRGKDIRELLERFTVVIYEGTPPINPETGVPTLSQLVVLTTDGNAPSGVDTEQVTNITCTVTTVGGTYTVTLNGVAYSYTSQTNDTAYTVLKALADKLKLNTVANVMAVPTGGGNGILCLRSKYVGESFTVAVSIDNNTYGTINKDDMESASANSNYCYFVYDSENRRLTIPSGVTWRGSGLKTGTASFFRILPRGDDGTATDTNAIRIQGTCGTFGADMILTNTTIYENGAVSITSGTFSISY